jgi:hypothetical protein
VISTQDALLLHTRLDSLRRAHDAYQAKGHRRYDPIVELAASEAAGRAENAALGASLTWQSFIPDVIAALSGADLLDRSDFRTLRSRRAPHVDGLTQKALKRLSYLQDWDATFYTVGHEEPAAGLENAVEDWHRYRMWSIHSTAGASRRTAESTRTGAHLLHQSSSAAVFLAAIAAATEDSELGSLAKSVLRVPPQIPRQDGG